MIKKFPIFFVVIILIFTRISVGDTDKEKKKTEILRLIQQMSSPQGSEDALFRIGYNYGLQPIPYLLNTLRSENVQVKCRSYEAIRGIIWDNFREDEPIPWKEIDLTLFEEDIRKNLEEAINIAIKDALTHPETCVRIKATDFLGNIGGSQVIDTLEKCLKDKDLLVRKYAVYGLSQFGKNYSYFEILAGEEPKTPEGYAKYLGDRYLCVEAMKKIREFGKEAAPVLIKVASLNKGQVRMRALSVLVDIKAEEAIPIFTNYLKEETIDETMYSVQWNCMIGLYNIGTEDAIKQLKEYGFKHNNPDIRYATAKILIKEYRQDVMPVLKELVKQGDSGMKFQVSRLLIENKEKEGIQILIGLLRDRKYFGEAKSWLEDITGQRFGEIPSIVSKKMLEEYIKKWEVWWEQNKDTFQFPEQDKQ